MQNDNFYYRRYFPLERINYSCIQGESLVLSSDLWVKECLR